MSVYDSWKQLARANLQSAFDRFRTTPPDVDSWQRWSALKHVCDEVDWANGNDVWKDRYRQLLKEMTRC